MNDSKNAFCAGFKAGLDSAYTWHNGVPTVEEACDDVKIILAMVDTGDGTSAFDIGTARHARKLIAKRCKSLGVSMEQVVLAGLRWRHLERNDVTETGGSFMAESKKGATAKLSDEQRIQIRDAMYEFVLRALEPWERDDKGEILRRRVSEGEISILPQMLEILQYLN
jgi:hypothetical protein